KRRLCGKKVGSVEWIASGAMSPRFFDVMTPGCLDPFGQCWVDGADDSSRHSHDQGFGRDLHPFRNDRSGSDHAPCAYRHSVQEDAPHTDKAVVRDGAAMENDPVTNRHSLADRAGHFLIDVHDGPVLDVRIGADDDGSHIATDDGVVPETGIFPDSDISHDSSGRGYESGRMDPKHPSARLVCRWMKAQDPRRGQLLRSGWEEHLSPGIHRRPILQGRVPGHRPDKVADRALEGRVVGGLQAHDVHSTTFGRNFYPEKRRFGIRLGIGRRRDEWRIHRLGPFLETHAFGVVAGTGNTSIATALELA